MRKVRSKAPGQEPSYDWGIRLKVLLYKAERSWILGRVKAFLLNVGLLLFLLFKAQDLHEHPGIWVQFDLLWYFSDFDRNAIGFFIDL